MALGTLWDSAVSALAQALILLTGYLGSYGVAIIVFTIAIKVILLPLTMQQVRSSRAMMLLQPELNELKKKYGKDREKFAQEQMRLYKENNINPLAGCLPLLIQMPIWFALYRALFQLSDPASGFAAAQEPFLWISSLSHPENGLHILAILTGITQWVTQRMMTPKSSDPQQQTMNQMMQFMPIMFVFFAFSVPAGLVLYWVTSNVVTFVQQYFMTGWGSLSIPRSMPSLSSFSLDALLGGAQQQPAARPTKAKGNSPAIKAPSSNGSATGALENAKNEEQAIAQAKGQAHGSRRKRKRR